MVGRKVALAPLEDCEKLKVTYNGRAKGLKNKTRELATLCDTPTLLISFGPTGTRTTCTWPEDQEEVCALILEFTSGDLGKRRRHRRGSSNGLLQVAKEEEPKSSLRASSVSAALLRDDQLAKMTLREVTLLYKSIDRASQMIEDKIKFLRDQKCLLHGHEIESYGSNASDSVSIRQDPSSAAELHQQIFPRNDQLDMINYADNLMVPYQVIRSPRIFDCDDDQLDVIRDIIPYEVTPLSPDSTSNCGSSSTPRNFRVRATELDHQIIPYSPHTPADDMGMCNCQVVLLDGQMKSAVCPHKMMCNGATGTTKLELELEVGMTSDNEILNSCNVEELIKDVALVSHAGNCLLQEIVVPPPTSQVVFDDLLDVDDSPCSHNFLWTSQLCFAADEQPAIDDISDWFLT